jgi:hypothetical protein
LLARRVAMGAVVVVEEDPDAGAVAVRRGVRGLLVSRKTWRGLTGVDSYTR